MSEEPDTGDPRPTLYNPFNPEEDESLWELLGRSERYSAESPDLAAGPVGDEGGEGYEGLSEGGEESERNYETQYVNLQEFLNDKIGGVNQAIEERDQSGGLRKAWGIYRRSSGIRTAVGIATSFASAYIGAGTGGTNLAVRAVRLLNSMVGMASGADEVSLGRQERAAIKILDEYRDSDGRLDETRLVDIPSREFQRMVAAFAMLTRIAEVKGLQIRCELSRQEIEQENKAQAKNWSLTTTKWRYLRRFCGRHESVARAVEFGLGGANFAVNNLQYLKEPIAKYTKSNWGKISAAVIAVAAIASISALNLPAAATIALRGGLGMLIGALRSNPQATTYQLSPDIEQLGVLIDRTLESIKQNYGEESYKRALASIDDIYEESQIRHSKKNKLWVAGGALIGGAIGMLPEILGRRAEAEEHKLPAGGGTEVSESDSGPAPIKPADVPQQTQAEVRVPSASETLPREEVRLHLRGNNAESLLHADPSQGGRADLRLAREVLKHTHNENGYIYEGLSAKERVILEEAMAKKWREAGFFDPETGNLRTEHAHDLIYKLDGKGDALEAYEKFRGNFGTAEAQTLFAQGVGEQAPNYERTDMPIPVNESIPARAASPADAANPGDYRGGSVAAKQESGIEPTTSTRTGFAHNESQTAAEAVFSNKHIPSLRSDQLYTLLTEKSSTHAGPRYLSSPVSDMITRMLHDKKIDPSDIKVVQDGYNNYQVKIRIDQGDGTMKYIGHQLKERFIPREVSVIDRITRSRALKQIVEAYGGLRKEEIDVLDQSIEAQPDVLPDGQHPVPGGLYSHDGMPSQDGVHNHNGMPGYSEPNPEQPAAPSNPPGDHNYIEEVEPPAVDQENPEYDPEYDAESNSPDNFEEHPLPNEEDENEIIST